MSDGLLATLIIGGIFGGIFTVLFGIAYISASFEARAFNRCTGSNATTMDALFTELRIENCAK